MELKKILVGIDGLKAKGNLDIDVNNIDSNSKNIKQGDLFIAIKGFSTDGHEYINVTSSGNFIFFRSHPSSTITAIAPFSIALSTY